jgi:hypothetical protein
MIDKLVNSFNDGEYYYSDLSTDCKIFSLHVALNALHKINFDDYITLILKSFLKYDEDYNSRDYTCCLKKVEKAYEVKDEENRRCVYNFNKTSIIRRHLLEYIIDGILHEKIHKYLINYVLRYFKTSIAYLQLQNENDFSRLKQSLKKKNIDADNFVLLLWIPKENKFSLLSNFPVENNLLDNVKNMWGDYCEQNRVDYITNVLKRENKISSYMPYLQHYNDGIIRF